MKSVPKLSVVTVLVQVLLPTTVVFNTFEVQLKINYTFWERSLSLPTSRLVDNCVWTVPDPLNNWISFLFFNFQALSPFLRNFPRTAIIAQLQRDITGLSGFRQCARGRRERYSSFWKSFFFLLLWQNQRCKRKIVRNGWNSVCLQLLEYLSNYPAAHKSNLACLPRPQSTSGSICI